MGIVLVSHSAPLARAVVTLAREVAGPDVALVAAGGTVAGDEVLGTDAARVAAAIDDAASPDGVLVLMDLGSAVLSAELALELLDPAARSGVLLCEAPLVEGAVAAAVAAGLGRPLAEVAAEARRGTAAKATHLGAGGPDPSPPGRLGAAREDDHEARLMVRLPHGLHVRPAARLVAAVGRFDATVTVANATTGSAPADARSLTALSVLGAREGHELVVRASGPEGAGALAAVLALAADGFGEATPAPAPVPPPAPLRRGPSAGPEGAEKEPAGPADGRLVGLAVSPGVVAGPARRLRRAPVAVTVPAGRSRTPGEEWAAFERALAVTRTEIEAARSSVAAAAGEDAAAIFDAHLLLLDDAALLAPVRRAVFEEGAGAAEAWQGAVVDATEAFVRLDDPYQRARGADVQDVGARVLARLLGAPVRLAPAEPGVVVAAALSPQELAVLDPEVAVGLATAAGGPLDHAAILARSLGVPAVFGLGSSLLAIPDGTPVVLDGDAGVLHLDPDPALLAGVAKRRAATGARARAAREAAAAPAVSRDGRQVWVSANVSSSTELDAVVADGADGVGLLRTEFLFVGRTEPPGEDEQFELYAAMAARLEGRPLVVRTLDAGGDKDLPWATDGAPSPNPALGLRGLRLGLAKPEILNTQLRALARAAAVSPGLAVLLPMVTTVDELRQAWILMIQAVAALRGRRRRAELGVMIEVPAAALRAARLAPYATFFSIGTNDLTQYTLAADRSSPQLASLADGLDPAVLYLVQMVVAAATGAGRPVTVCGALAADPEALPLLVGLGVDRLSVPPAAVPLVKQAVRDLSVRDASVLAERALGLESAAAVRALVRAR